MKSLRYVFGRGVFALVLMAIGVGSGIGMPPAKSTAEAPDCIHQAPALIAADTSKPTTDVLVVMVHAPVKRPGEAS